MKRRENKGANNPMNKSNNLMTQLESEMQSVNRQLITLKNIIDDAKVIMDKITMNDGQMSYGRLLKKLSPREKEVFSLIGQGLGVKKISKMLGISFKTVESHREHMKKKLGLEKASELKMMARNKVK